MSRRPSSLWMLLVACAALVIAATAADASIVTFTSRAAFEAQGTIVENYGFEDFGSTGQFAYPGDPWTAHGVTYTSGANIIVKPDSWYLPTSNVLAHDYWSPLPGDIDPLPQYGMFGLDLSLIGAPSPVTFTVFTNLGSYSLTNLSLQDASVGADFYGFVASGEYFTGFNLASDAGSGSAPVIDNVTLGTVPEPGTLLLLGAGLSGLVLRRGRRT